MGRELRPFATNLVGEIVLMGIVDVIAGDPVVCRCGCRLQYLQMVIGKVDPDPVRRLVAVKVVGACRVWRQGMTRT